MMNTRVRIMAIYLFGAVAFAQTTPVVEQPVVITVEGDNYVIYRGTTFDLSKIAKDPSPTTSVQTAFLTFVNVGDIRTVNGKPAKGLYSSQGPRQCHTAQALNPASQSPTWTRAACSNACGKSSRLMESTSAH
jgi:hypothetical protein